MRLAVVCLTLVFFLVACNHHGTDGDNHPGPDWERPWKDAAGNVLGERVISTFRGPEHCDWESSVFLYLGWPLGTRSESAADARQYLRDPEGIFSGDTAVSFEPDARLPVEARDSGYRLGDYSIWLAGDARQAVYVVRGSDVERWPRAKRPIACA